MVLLRYKRHWPKQPADFVHEAEELERIAAELPDGHPEKAEAEECALYARQVACTMIERCLSEFRMLH